MRGHKTDDDPNIEFSRGINPHELGRTPGFLTPFDVVGAEVLFKKVFIAT